MEFERNFSLCVAVEKAAAALGDLQVTAGLDDRYEHGELEIKVIAEAAADYAVRLALYDLED